MEYVIQNGLEALPLSSFDPLLEHLETQFSVSNNSLCHYLLDDVDVCNNDVETAVLSPPPSPPDLDLGLDLEFLADVTSDHDYFNECFTITDELYSLDLYTILDKESHVLAPPAITLPVQSVTQESHVDYLANVEDQCVAAMPVLSPPPSPELLHSANLMDVMNNEGMDWVPEVMETVTIVLSSSSSSPPAKKTRKTCLNAVERRSNKRLSNRESAARYRDKVKMERREQQCRWMAIEKENTRLREALRESIQEERALVKILRDVEQLRAQHLCT